MEIKNSTASGTASKKHSRFLNWKIILAAVLLVALIVVVNVRRSNAHSAPIVAMPVTVAVVKVTREDLSREVTIPAEFRPYAEVELHAKVSGYVEQIKVDIGDKVKAGQLLAVLEVPELRDQLHSALAAEQQAGVDYTNAHLMQQRLESVSKQHTNLVAQQDLDTAAAKNGSAAAALAAAQANVERYETLAKYTRITAPFDGVVTKRYADPGALIQAGTTSDTQARPLVRVSDNYHLRLDFYASVDMVKFIHQGDQVEVRVDSLGSKPFAGTIARFTSKVEEMTRKMATEIEVANPNLEIVPGMYASVTVKMEQHPQVLAIPAEAVSGGKNPTVYVITAANEIESRPVTLGLETPDKFEVTSGLQAGDSIMTGSRALVHPGQKVESKIVEKVAVQ